MSTLAKKDEDALVEQALIEGDLSKLKPQERVNYYMQTCQSLQLNPLTKPFEYISLNGTLKLYARKDCTDQLRNIRKVNIPVLERELLKEINIYTVTAHAETPDGRQDSAIGAVSIANLTGKELANAIMKAETKAKRRVTLSICGLGILDESEITSIQNARYVPVNYQTGEIESSKPNKTLVAKGGAIVQRIGKHMMEYQGQTISIKERWEQIEAENFQNVNLPTVIDWLSRKEKELSVKKPDTLEAPDANFMPTEEELDVMQGIIAEGLGEDTPDYKAFIAARKNKSWAACQDIFTQANQTIDEHLASEQ